jgi:hypothetical protein
MITPTRDYTHSIGEKNTRRVPLMDGYTQLLCRDFLGCGIRTKVGMCLYLNMNGHYISWFGQPQERNCCYYYWASPTAHLHCIEGIIATPTTANTLNSGQPPPLSAPPTLNVQGPSSWYSYYSRRTEYWIHPNSPHNCTLFKVLKLILPLLLATHWVLEPHTNKHRTPLPIRSCPRWCNFYCWPHSDYWRSTCFLHLLLEDRRST